MLPNLNVHSIKFTVGEAISWIDPSILPWRKVSAEYFRESGLVEPLLGDGDHGVVEFCSVETGGIDRVQFEKDEGRTHRGAFVVVDERLVLRGMKSIGRRAGRKISLPIIKRRLWLHQRRVQHAGITQAIESAVFLP